MFFPSFILVTTWCMVLPCLANLTTENDTHELHGRGIRVVGSSGPGGIGGIRDLFLIDEHSDCDNRIAKLDAWVQEAAILHTGLDHAFRHASKSENSWGPYIAHFMMFFGLEFDFAKRKWKEDDSANKEILAALRDHIDRVTRFLTGGILDPANNPAEKPRLFCSGAAFELQEPGRIARDINDEDIVRARDETTGVPTQYLTVDFAFQTQRAGGYNVFRVPAFNGYDFSRPDNMCPPVDKQGNGRLGRTGKPTSNVAFNYWMDEGVKVPYDMGKSNRHVILCPAAFETTKGHAVPSLSETVGDLYPTEFADPAVAADKAPPGAIEKALDKMMTQGATFYHELFHLTDNGDTLPHSDPLPYSEIYHVNTIASGVKSLEEDKLLRRKLAHNPESYALLAQALHIYRNPPEGKKRAAYGIALPMDAARIGHDVEYWEIVKNLP